ncbi:DNA polymerase delta small subunit-like isoform X3 [Juglans microcarpa x Juglans regia]|uniref:DNA polymerase delta small subunit-like isoform X3 n=1 Tax=Juglans microcarpa x Juglans regia TaxID=2249226 RepID=UPI001B7E1870|nr:DNA polymerase delta small subunit-like isoform X3 [Juglans microcarpa x Juglans regia]
MAEVLTRVRFRYLCRLLLDLRYYFIPSFPIGNPIYQFAQFAIGLEEGKECILAGTLNMHMKLKPCVLDEYSEEALLLLCMERKLTLATFWFKMSWRLAYHLR